MRKVQLHPLANTERGLIPVNPRNTKTRELLDGAEPVQMPVGQQLIDAVRTYMSESTMVAEQQDSAALKRYLKEELGISYRDAIDEFLAGQPLGTMTVKRFLTNTGLRPLFSPVVEDGLRIGLNRVAAAWRELIAQEIPVDNVAYEYYEFDNGNATDATVARDRFGLQRVAQGAPIPVARVVVTGKSYTLYKQGRGIEWTDEAKNAPIDLAQMWFQQVGLQIGWDLHDQLVETLLNGYFVDGSDAPPVLSTALAGTMTDSDLLTAYRTHTLTYGYTADTLILGLARNVSLQVMETGAGQRIFQDGFPGRLLPTITNVVISEKVPSDKVIFLDSNFGLMRLVNKEFGTEFAREVQTQTEGSYGTSIELTVPLFKHARLVLDA